MHFIGGSLAEGDLYLPSTQSRKQRSAYVNQQFMRECAHEEEFSSGGDARNGSFAKESSGPLTLEEKALTGIIGLDRVPPQQHASAGKLEQEVLDDRRRRYREEHVAREVRISYLDEEHAKSSNFSSTERSLGNTGKGRLELSAEKPPLAPLTIPGSEEKSRGKNVQIIPPPQAIIVDEESPQSSNSELKDNTRKEEEDGKLKEVPASAPPPPLDPEQQAFEKARRDKSKRAEVLIDFVHSLLDTKTSLVCCSEEKISLSAELKLSRKIETYAEEFL